MTIVSAVTTYFAHSNYVTHHLKEELKKEKDQRGIQVAGATRFSSFSIHARSISRCLHPIQHCLASGAIKFDTAAVSFLHFCEGNTLLNGSRQNLSANALRQDQTVSNFNWISITWISFSPPSRVAWRLSKDRIRHVLMYFMFTLVLQWILWQCFWTGVSLIHEAIELDTEILTFR